MSLHSIDPNTTRSHEEVVIVRSDIWYNFGAGSETVHRLKTVIREQRGRIDTWRSDFRGLHQPPCEQTRLLLYPCATPLNQDDQHDNKEHPGYNPDYRVTVHIDSLTSLNG